MSCDYYIAFDRTQRHALAIKKHIADLEKKFNLISVEFILSITDETLQIHRIYLYC